MIALSTSKPRSCHSPRVLVFLRFESPDLPPYAEHLAAFKAENNVGPNDALYTVRLIFAGPNVG